MAKILVGKNVISALDRSTELKVKALKQKGVYPCLAIIRIGDNDDDVAYQNGANRRAEKTGVKVKNYNLPSDISQKDVVSLIHTLNEDNFCNGVLLLRPLPPHIDEDEVRNELSPEKDMDGITDVSMASVYSGSGEGYPPCTPAGCIRILDYYGIKIEGQRIVIIGRSEVVGRPLALMLIKRNAAVTICHSKVPAETVKDYCRKADIIIVTAGVKKLLDSEYIADMTSDEKKAGFCSEKTVIDVGIHADDDGEYCGDVDFEDVEPYVSAITPVPGGVGTITSSILISHVVSAANKMLIAGV